MLKILGRNNSVNVQKVLWCCDEVGAAFEREDFGGAFGRNNTPEYKSMNPTGLVPTLVDGKTILWESNTIVRYLAAKYSAGNLWPTDAAARATADKWMDFQVTSLVNALTPVFWGLIRTKPEDRNWDTINAARDKFSGYLAMVDHALGHAPYLGGQNFTMGDIPVGVMTFRWYALDIKREDYKNLKTWYDRISARPAFKKHMLLPLT